MKRRDFLTAVGAVGAAGRDFLTAVGAVGAAATAGEGAVARPHARTHIVIPYAPRPLQQAIHDALDRYRWGVAVCHRRFGKTVCAVNHLQKAALLCRKPRPRFAYIAPTYAQGKAIAWDYMKHYADPVPGMRPNESELRIDYASNDSQVRIFGADNPDSLRGLYFDGVVLDEYGLMRPRLFAEVILPTLTDRQGWAMLMGTPNGRNEFYRKVQEAKNDPTWFLATYKASETGVISAEDLAVARSQMTDDQYEQEFECSFEASVQGAIFARELRAAHEDGRVTTVPYDPMLPVDTDWDLGMDDSTAIWFSQTHPGGMVGLIDYYEASGQGLVHYRDILSQKPYTYDTHWAPHDINVRELGVGKSRLSIAGDLGLFFQIAPRVSSEKGQEVHEGINAARMFFNKCYFDAKRCQAGLEALQNYHWPFNKPMNEFNTSQPVHDWSSHGADAFRGLAVRHYGVGTLRRPVGDRDPDPVETAHKRMVAEVYWQKPKPSRGMGRGGY